MPAAALGPCSPLPLLDPMPSVAALADGVPAEIAARARSGAPASLHPYLAQDDYARELTPMLHRVAVLENDALRATVALGLGGRVLSLYDRRAERELLYVNPVLQPANLALRNAWFSGGVEWNIGTRGHSPTTMDALHAASVDGPDGEPVLRLWERERTRGVVFQIDLSLPSSSPALVAHVRIRNLGDEPTPMYWWTNAAITARPGVRVLAPATRAFRTEYPNRLRVAAVPDDGGVDVTYPCHHADAADLFFDLPAEGRPWIAAVDAAGTGIAHVSTAGLRGRKLFVWGTGAGGQRWQRWLSHDGEEVYAEIQAGLAPTQYEHVTMPARAEWNWTEAFCAVAADPPAAHGADWQIAVGSVERSIEAAIPSSSLDDWHRTACVVAEQPVLQALSGGSGWGTLERRRREASGEAWFDDAPTPFPDSSLQVDQDPWMALLETGELPAHAVAVPPPSYVIGRDWEARLAAAPPTWLTDYHRAVMAHGRGDLDGASDLYRSSLGREDNAWSRRGLAMVARADGRRADAAEHAMAAARSAPGEWRLAAEAISRLLDDGRPGEALAVLNEVPDDDRRRSRLLLLEAWAAHEAGDAARAAAILDAGLEVADLREGERSLDALWAAVHPDRPLPPEYDFRMHSA